MKSVFGAINHGYECLLIEIECSLSSGLPVTSIVGLGSKSVDESRERIRAAFKASDLPYPKKKVLLNLAPADIPKNDSGLDLGMAVALLNTHSQSQLVSEPTLFLGELSLSGGLRPVRGLIGKLLAANRSGIKNVVVPKENEQEASLVPELNIMVASSLKEVSQLLSGALTPTPPTASKPIQNSNKYTLNEVKGHHQTKRALVVAIAGGHNIHLFGPPGSGKSMLAQASCDLLEPLTNRESLEVTHIHSLGKRSSGVITHPPFRSPHHTASNISLIGGGSQAKPGEISLAHKGLLLLDEFPEFSRASLESLRQPLEDRRVTISRAEITTTYPADFVLVATSNPCPCGNYGSSKECTCTAYVLDRYQKKLSGPIMDRIDMHIFVPSVSTRELFSSESDENDETHDYKRQINRAKRIQRRRNTDGKLNSGLSLKELRREALVSASVVETAEAVADELDLSTRGFIRLLRIARTIADLEDVEDIEEQHILEAAQYREKTTK